MTESNIGRRRALARREGNAAYLEKRGQVVRAATLLFKEKGFDATTLNNIAEEVGVDRASLYYYFDSKEELLQEAVGDVTGRNLEMIRALRRSDLAPAERLAQLIHNAIASFDENYPQVFVYIQEEMTRLRSREDPWAKAMLKQTREFEQALLDLLRDGVEAGVIRADLDLQVAAQALWGMINWTHRWYKPGHHKPEQVADVFSAVFLDGVKSAHEKGWR